LNESSIRKVGLRSVAWHNWIWRGELAREIVAVPAVREIELGSMVVEGDFQSDKGLSMEPVAGVGGAREGKVEGN